MPFIQQIDFQGPRGI